MTTDDLAWRPLTRDDAPVLYPLQLAVARDAGQHADLPSEAETAAMLDGPSFDLPVDSLAASDGDRLVAAGLVNAVGPGREFTRVWCFGGVHPSRTGEGLGRRLLEWQIERGTERFTAMDTGGPGVLETTAMAGHQAARLFARHGFEPVRYWSHMSHDLSDIPAAEVDLPVAPYRGELSERVRRAHNDAFADHWGSAERDKSSWREHHDDHPTFRPDLSFLVLDGDPDDPQVAAYLTSWENTEGDRKRLYIGLIGCRRPWRKRGLASALVAAALTEARAQDFDEAGLTVDTDNPSGAHSLYERLGFTVGEQHITYHRPITG